MFSSDGVNPFKSSSKSFWPSYIIINEIDPLKRFSIENVCLVSLTNGQITPAIDIWLAPLMQEIQLFEKGLKIGDTTYKAILWNTVFDIPGLLFMVLLKCIVLNKYSSLCKGRSKFMLSLTQDINLVYFALIEEISVMDL